MIPYSYLGLDFHTRVWVYLSLIAQLYIQISFELKMIIPIATGNTPVYDWIFESVDNNTVHSTPNSFHQDFTVVLKRTLQNYCKILMKCFLVIYINNRAKWLQTFVAMKIPRLNRVMNRLIELHILIHDYSWSVRALIICKGIYCNTTLYIVQ